VVTIPVKPRPGLWRRTLAAAARVDQLRDPYHQFLLALNDTMGTSAGEMPEGLSEAIDEARTQGDGEVYVTQGRVRGEPVFVVIYPRPDGDPLIAGQVKLRPHQWSAEQLAGWPETGAGNARTWQVTEQ
jgi:hypothetical protein